MSALSITVSPSYCGQRNLAELALPDNVPVLTEASQHRDTASSLTDPQVCQFAVLVTFSLIHVIVYVCTLTLLLGIYMAGVCVIFPFSVSLMECLLVCVVDENVHSCKLCFLCYCRK